MKSWQTRRFEIADDPGAPQTIARMFTYFIFLMSWAGLVMAVIIRPLLEITTPIEFHLAYRIAQVEIVTIILQGAGFHLLFGLAYAKDTAMISKLRGSAAAFKILLSWIFISNWGIYGAAFSAAVTGFLSNILVFYFSQKHYRLQLEWKTLSFIALSGTGVFLLVSQWDTTVTGIYRVLDGGLFPWLNENLAATFLGTWKDGKVITILGERSGLMAEVAIKGACATCFIMVLPAIHPPTRKRWIRKVKARFVPVSQGGS